MKQFWKDMGIAVIMGLIVPAVLLSAAVSLLAQEREPAEDTEPDKETELAAPTEKYVPRMQVSVLAEDGQVVQMALDEYLTCVLLCEMPVYFEEEALKAQSVVARTYIIRASRGAAKHEQAAVCTQSSCCQGFLAVEEYLAAGGQQEDIQHIRDLILETDGQVLTYEGNLIEATYFSCSGGSTEDAVAVWGTDVPYLRSVASPGEENAAHYTDTVTFSPADFASKLGITLSGEASDWFGNVTYTAGGGVAAMEIGGQAFTGTELRKLLNLRSTAFDMTAVDGAIMVVTRGFGHRVGMSQYGADAMAKTGSNYKEILSYYYQGTQLEQYTD